MNNESFVPSEQNRELYGVFVPFAKREYWKAPFDYWLGRWDKIVGLFTLHLYYGESDRLQREKIDEFNFIPQDAPVRYPLVLLSFYSGDRNNPTIIGDSQMPRVVRDPTGHPWIYDAFYVFCANGIAGCINMVVDAKDSEESNQEAVQRVTSGANGRIIEIADISYVPEEDCYFRPLNSADYQIIGNIAADLTSGKYR